MKANNKQTSRRLIPCPPYDVEACESWLGDMSEKGLFLEQWGLYTARFRLGPPLPARYRLTAARLEGSILAGPPLAPDAEEQSLYEEAGWHFICRQDEFFIYACSNPLDPEPHTDPTVQALSLKMARRSALWSLLGFIAVFSMNLFSLYSGHPALLFVEFPVITLLWFLFALWNILSAAWAFYCISALRVRLNHGLPPDHHKNWRRSAPLYQFVNLMRSLLVPLLAVLLVFVLTHPGRKIPPSLTRENTRALPFATLGDAAEGTVVWEEDTGRNTIEVRHSLLAPVIIEYHESGQVEQNGETVLDASLRVNCYETRTPWLARLLVNDLHKDLEIYADKPEELPELPGIDAAWGYSDGTGVFRQLILVRGNRVMSALWTDTASSVDFAQLAHLSAAVFSQDR